MPSSCQTLRVVMFRVHCALHHQDSYRILSDVGSVLKRTCCDAMDVLSI